MPGRFVQPVQVAPAEFDTCMTRAELLEEVAKRNPVKGYRSMTKAQLIQALRE